MPLSENSMNNKALYIAVFVFSFFAFNCKKEKQSIEESGNINSNNNPFATYCDSAIMTAFFDSAQYFPTAFYNSYLLFNSSNNHGRKLVVKTYFNGGTFTMTITNWEWQNPPNYGVLAKTYSTLATDSNHACMLNNGTNLCDGVEANFRIGNDYLSSVYTNYPGIVTISECDVIKNTITGTYKVKVQDITGNFPHMIEGTFTNLCYP